MARSVKHHLIILNVGSPKSTSVQANSSTAADAIYCCKFLCPYFGMLTWEVKTLTGKADQTIDSKLSHQIARFYAHIWTCWHEKLERWQGLLANDCLKIKGGSPWFFVKLDSEVAVDEQTRPITELLRGSGLRVPTGARGTATPIFGQFLAQFCQITLTCSKPCFGVLYL